MSALKHFFDDGYLRRKKPLKIHLQLLAFLCTLTHSYVRAGHIGPTSVYNASGLVVMSGVFVTKILRKHGLVLLQGTPHNAW